MRKLLLLIAASLLGVGLYAQNAKIKLDAPTTRATCTNNSFKQFDASFSFNEVELTKVETKGGTFASVSIPGTFPTGEFGAPEVPAVRKLIAVPVGATPIVRVKNFTEQVYSLNQYGSEKLMPHQPSMSKSDDPEKVPFIYNAAAYARKGFVGQELTQVEVLGAMRGVRIAALTINPVLYDAAANQLKVRNNIEIEVSFQGADEVATQRLYDASFSPYFEIAYKQLFNKDVYTDHPDLYKTPARMLVVAGAKFKEALKPWLTWKAQKGFYLDVHYTDEAEVGTTNASIKAFIHKKYKDGLAANAAPVFLALIGDTDVISGEKGKKTKKITDLYYSAVDGDYFPEMYSFRMSASSGEELTNIINKVLMYEKATMPDKSYLEKVLLIAGADHVGWNPKVAQPTIKYGMKYYFNQEHGYTNVYNYLDHPYSGCYSHLNTGVGFVNYTAHGSETSWADPVLTTTQLKALTNKDKYFLAIGNCCVTAQFDYPQPCFGEVMTRVKEKGAYAYIGSSPNSYWGEDYYWSVGANAVFGQQPTYEGTTMGSYDATFLEDSYNTVNSIMWAGNLAATHAGNIGNITHIGAHYYWEAYHVLGDGSVMPYRAMPKTNTYTLPASLPQNQASYNIQASAGSYVAISKDGVLYGTGVANASGVATVDMTKQITENGNYDVVITRSNYFPVIKQIQAGEPTPHQPVSNLTATTDGQKVTLKWDAPNGTNPNPNPDPNPEPGLTESFDGGIPATWTLIDADGDGHGWKHGKAPGVAGYNSNGCVYSESFGLGGVGALTPDNYLITPALNLPNGGKLTFWVCAQDAAWAAEHYAVYASSTGNAASNFTNALLEETLTAKGVRSPEAIRGRVQGTWYQKTVDLPAGTKYVAFRHFQSTDMFYIDIDEVEIKANAKRGDFTETFESSTHGEAPMGWTTIDADGDSQGWICLSGLDWLTPHGGTKVVGSFSWNGEPLNPDNYLISKDVTGATKVKYYYAVNKKYPQEHYAVMISKTGTNAEDFTVVYEETPNGTSKGGARFGLTTKSNGAKDQSEWIERTVDLPAGTKYVAFRHFNCTDLNFILLDDIQFVMGGSPDPTDYTYTVYRDGTKIKEGLTATTFEEDGVAAGNHEYCVEVKYEAGVSPKKCVNVTLAPVQLNPVKNLKAERDGNDVVLKWEAPSGKRGELLDEDFEGGAIPTGWTVLDADGDGNNWSIVLSEHTRGGRLAPAPLRASNVAISFSAVELPTGAYQALTPNNFLITPKVEGAKKITYKVGSPGLPQWSHDHYALCISKTGTAASDFEVIFEETMTYTNGGANLTREKDLPAGTKYVAFRHYNCTDVLGIMIDDVEITGEGGAPDYTYTVYRDGTKIKEGLTETTYKDLGQANANHEYCVEVQYATGVSPKECVTFSSVETVTAQKPYTLTVVGKTITVSCQGQAMIYDMNGRRLAAGRNTVVYTAQGGYYAVMIVVDGKSYVEKLAIK